jgi:ribosome-associated translation inhibitor RaiA
MQATQITLHNIRRSPTLSARIRELSERLESHHAGIIHCRVAVTQETGSSRKGRLNTVSVRVRVPGHEFVAGQQGEDVYVVLREAFDVMRRQLSQAAEAAAHAARHPREAPVAEAQS